MCVYSGNPDCGRNLHGTVENVWDVQRLGIQHRLCGGKRRTTVTAGQRAKQSGHLDKYQSRRMHEEGKQ